MSLKVRPQFLCLKNFPGKCLEIDPQVLCTPQLPPPPFPLVINGGYTTVDLFAFQQGNKPPTLTLCALFHSRFCEIGFRLGASDPLCMDSTQSPVQAK